MIGTKINLIDQSEIPEVQETTVVDDSPVVLAPIFSSKGTEKWVDIKGKDFTTMFGKCNFRKYGQASIQLANAIADGARIVGMRMVPDDASLANTVISATVTSTPYQKTNADGELLYKTSAGEEVTTSDGNTPIMIDKATIKYVAESITEAKTLDAVEEGGAALASSDKYPLFAITDNGRGVSGKKFYISPDRDLSKNLDFMFYTINVLEDGSVTDAARFALVPDLVYAGVSTELTQVSKSSLTQVQAICFNDSILKFVSKVAESSGISTAELWTMDVLFATTRKGNDVASLAIDNSDEDNGPIVLNSSTGIALANGEDGTCGEAPAQNKSYYDSTALKFFNGTASSNIYNLDNYPIDLVLDANYSVDVKNAITKLAEYRQDFMFFRDYGLNCYAIQDVQDFNQQLDHSKFVTDFCQAYEVIDSYSKKQIKVTMVYDIARKIIPHMIGNKTNRPFAGIANSATMDNAIAGTLTYEPKITPNVDEKSLLEDLRVNFASYFNKQLVIESLFTAQVKYTQLSFSNNVMAIETVLKGLRKTFPAIRYQFISNESDLESYSANINSYLGQYASWFEELTFEYVADPAMVANKIFKAAIYFRCKDFAMAELIDAYVLPSAIALN